MELKINYEKVLAAALKYPQAKEVLKEMFPETFIEAVDPRKFTVSISTNTLVPLWTIRDQEGSVILSPVYDGGPYLWTSPMYKFRVDSPRQISINKRNII